MIKNNIILELLKIEIKKREVTKESVINKYNDARDRDDVDMLFMNVSLDVSGFDEDLIFNQLVILQESKKREIKGHGRITISGFISSFQYYAEDGKVNLSVPFPNLIRLIMDLS